jgi:hypothetical protein
VVTSQLAINCPHWCDSKFGADKWEKYTEYITALAIACRPGFRVNDAPLSDELQRARETYVHDLTTAWRRGAGKEDVVPDAPKASSRDGTPVDDIETAYRLYAEEISKA